MWERPQHPQAAETTWAASQRATTQSGRRERAAGRGYTCLALIPGRLADSFK